MEHFHVRVASDRLAFSAAHFITFGKDQCERLHGHNYRVAAEVSGPLDENHYVVDFVALESLLREIVGRLDHRVMLPAEHPGLEVSEQECEVTVRLGRRRWVFPRDDCVILPVANTTTELLARHIGQLLIQSLRGRCGLSPGAVRVELEEGLGQVAVWRSQGL
ncbi:MAG TPA: 6-pyruvoyl tetrahydropterin synthase family protein [Planctomycetaceae bacterium]|nr:6-pyruvoyl tetrahydropterin synthase family protein [Planctomycetaceae bacterium]HIQ20650.1 6-pyruvoyl tetrahydropterin synthase family protein [Planctomycetota bacterium]